MILKWDLGALNTFRMSFWGPPLKLGEEVYMGYFKCNLYVQNDQKPSSYDSY